MDDEQLPKRLFYGDVTTGARRQGGQKRRYEDALKNSLKQMQINPATWEDLAQDRSAWHRLTQQSMRPTGSPPPRPKERHESHQPAIL
ncbi:unnamed protein product [Schistocephalus solidus]|uniref:Uncharacterized protein n=1 Tax=Schistocephalus solidus TaxID=70667 RepID=A0A183TG19_SCHSO|nr:unnamed protein product [Schistocephalus solidus]